VAIEGSEEDHTPSVAPPSLGFKVIVSPTHTSSGPVMVHAMDEARVWIVGSIKPGVDNSVAGGGIVFDA